MIVLMPRFAITDAKAFVAGLLSVMSFYDLFKARCSELDAAGR